MSLLAPNRGRSPRLESCDGAAPLLVPPGLSARARRLAAGAWRCTPSSASARRSSRLPGTGAVFRRTRRSGRGGRSACGRRGCRSADIGAVLVPALETSAASRRCWSRPRRPSSSQGLRVRRRSRLRTRRAAGSGLQDDPGCARHAAPARCAASTSWSCMRCSSTRCRPRGPRGSQRSPRALSSSQSRRLPGLRASFGAASPTAEAARAGRGTLAEAGSGCGGAQSSSPSRCTQGQRWALPAAAIFGFGALGWNGLVYVSAGERTPPELAARSVGVRGDGDLRLSAVATRFSVRRAPGGVVHLLLVRQLSPSAAQRSPRRSVTALKSDCILYVHRRGERAFTGRPAERTRAWRRRR